MKQTRHCYDRHSSGVAAVLAMMFMVIFSSLAAAMAIVAQVNLSTADSHLKVNRVLSAVETGMQFVMFRLNRATGNVLTTDGLIDEKNAVILWETTKSILLADLQNELHNLGEPVQNGKVLQIGPISLGAGYPAFTAGFTPHPIPSEDYDGIYYDREPYITMGVSNVNPMDATWVRVRVEAIDGPTGHEVTRGIEMDFKIDKKIRFAILSKSRVMIGRHVMIEGAVGSRFTDTHLTNGHPLQMVSDFRGLHARLDQDLDMLTGILITNDMNGDNRLNLNDPLEIAGIINPASLDANMDGHIDDYDMFIDQFDANGDGAVSALELDTANNIIAAQLLMLIDTFGDPMRDGYYDGLINSHDNYAKIRGQVMVKANLSGWEAGAANLNGSGFGAYQDFFQGPIISDYKKAPLQFNATDVVAHQFEPSDFDVSSFRNMTASDSFIIQTGQQLAQHNPNDPSSPQPVGATTEEVPYGSAHPYDYYDRPVYENMTFHNVRISIGTNALFKNCKFIGVTFVETTINNDDPNFNYAGMQEADGSMKFPGMQAQVGGGVVANTKTVANNLRFDNCTIEGAIVSDVPTGYTHARNKIAMTGNTRFVIDQSTELDNIQKTLFNRSMLLVPHYSVEIGTFVGASDPSEFINMSGTIVAGVIDVRGQVAINGTLLTTFLPTSDVGPVIGPTSPQFNTTLGYFSSSTGDMEAELPASGLGVIQIRYDPSLAMPDGILGPIEILPNAMTYRETGAK